MFVVEKRSSFSRNNVLHLWPFLIDDLKSLGAKKFYGKFCAGAIDHIGGFLYTLCNNALTYIVYACMIVFLYVGAWFCL